VKKAAQSVILEDAFYKIAAPNGRVLEVADFNTENGAAVQLWDDAGQPWQQWSFVPAGGGSYRIKNRFTGKVIDLAFRGTVQGTLLHQWSEVSHKSQQWLLEPGARGTRIRSVLAGKCVDLAEMCTSNGARAQIWADVDGGNQEWRILRVQDRQSQPRRAEDAAPGSFEESEAKTVLQRRHEEELVRKIGGRNKETKHRGKR